MEKPRPSRHIRRDPALPVALKFDTVAGRGILVTDRPVNQMIPCKCLIRKRVKILPTTPS